jgi:Ca2+-binding RTX toxin-like protein
MRRTTPLTAAAFLGLALLSPTTATAAGETCHGEAATIVGTGATVTGTEGRDVIVTGSAGVVDALGGDDLICIAGTVANSNVLSVRAGTGNDVVDATRASSASYVTTVLGAGADTFTGDVANDTVFGGLEDGTDTERDTIVTGSGADTAVSGTPAVAGTPSVPNHDVVDTGTGDDSLALGSPALAADASLVGGDDRDTLRLVNDSAELAIDMTVGTFTTPAGVARFASYEALDITTGAGRLTYRGTPRDDLVTVHPTSGTPLLDIATEAGQDGIVVEPATIAAGSRIDGGDGRNKIVAATGTGQMTFDMWQHVLVVDGRSMTATNIQDAYLIATDVVMVGDHRGNNLTFSGCSADLDGGRGRDRLANVYDGYFEKYAFDCPAGTRMSGGAGADYLRGGQGDDRLIGGSGTDENFGRGGDDRIRGNEAGDTIDGGEGRDDIRGGGGPDKMDGRYAADTLIGGSGRATADGSRGRDRCVAERETRCER